MKKALKVIDRYWYAIPLLLFFGIGLFLWDGIYNHNVVCTKHATIVDITELKNRTITAVLDNGDVVKIDHRHVKQGGEYCFEFKSVRK